MTNEQAKNIKKQCIDDIMVALPTVSARLDHIDLRLMDYIADAANPHHDNANLYELLGIRKFLRMIDTYPFNVEKVQRIYRAFEHLKFSGLNGKQQYPLTPIQTYLLAGPFGFMRSEDDYRRICTEANYFVPRKFSKTTTAAFIIFWFFFFEDYNAEAYCTANSADQSKILFRLASDLIKQMDPNGKHIRFTATEVNWYSSMERESKVCALSAGGKTKDGLFAQLCCADEYGSAGYVKDHSDMANLVNVVEGSMGPRREPMTVITTTAGRVQEGPYERKLREIKASLLNEMTIELDGQPHPLDNDWQFALICCPDQWEESDEDLQRPEVWRKVNRHIGITIQPDYYANEWAKMKIDQEKKREQITKLFNVWQTGRVTAWISGDRIRPLQVNKRITDCLYKDGWRVFNGLDFSHGDDLFASTYLAVNYNSPDPKGRFFVDFDAWILESALKESPNRKLFEQWIADGWLNMIPGEVFNSAYAIDAIAEKNKSGLDFRAFGYDAAQAIEPINNLKAWLQSLGATGDDILRMVVPVGQSSMTQNPRILELEALIKSPEQFIEFSANPMWPWLFGNAVTEMNSAELRRVLKVSQHNKIDPIAGLLDALYLFDLSEGRIEK